MRADDIGTGDVSTDISTDAILPDDTGPPSGDWLDAQLSRIDLLLCASAEPAQVARSLLLDLAPLLRAVQGAAYVLESGAGELSLAAGYAAGEKLPARIALGEGLLGQCAASRRKLVVSGVSSDYFRVHSALGSSTPASLAFVPVALESGALAVLELAFLARGPAVDVLLDHLAQRSARGSSRSGESFEPALVTPGSHTPSGHTPSSDTPAQAGARGPATTPVPATSARQRFWSTLSHDLRSPLNSVIVLSQVLAENVEQNLSEKQVNLARVIHGSGKDLLALVDTLSLLAKIEARRLILSPGELELGALERQLSRVFEPLAQARGLRSIVELEPGAPRAILTDPLRVRQVVECMWVAALERADGPVVRLRIGQRRSGWSNDRERLEGARVVLAFDVDVPSQALAVDRPLPGAGEASRSAEADEAGMGTPALGMLARGGGLGLAISRELAGLLGGELRQDGSSARLTLFLPVAHVGSPAAQEEPMLARDGRVEMEGERTRPSADGASPAAGSRVDAEHERPSMAVPARVGELEGLELLLVDFDVRQAFTLTGHLERQGAAVVHADDLGEALDRLGSRRLPSAVLIDARVLRASPEPSVQRVLRLAEQTPFVVLREPGDEATRLPHVLLSSRSADAREIVSLLRRVAARPGSLQTRAR